jgi:hypothetical protein
MIAPQPHEDLSGQVACGDELSAATGPLAPGADPRLSLVAAVQASGPNGHRLSGLLPGRPYRLSAPEDRDETVRQVRAHFGVQDFWDPV